MITSNHFTACCVCSDTTRARIAKKYELVQFCDKLSLKFEGNAKKIWQKFKTLLDCTERLTVLSEVNQLTTMWVPGDRGIQQNEIVDRLAREGARTRPISPEPFSPLSLSRFKSKIRNWIEKRKQNGKSVKSMGPANCVWRDQLIGMFSS